MKTLQDFLYTTIKNGYSVAFLSKRGSVYCFGVSKFDSIGGATIDYDTIARTYCLEVNNSGQPKTLARIADNFAEFLNNTRADKFAELVQIVDTMHAYASRIAEALFNAYVEAVSL